MLWQTDASKFEWFGKGKGYATLHAYIDDATGRVVGAWFTKNESTAGYVTALGIGLEHYGLPMEIYSDRHSMLGNSAAICSHTFTHETYCDIVRTRHHKA